MKLESFQLFSGNFRVAQKLTGLAAWRKNMANLLYFALAAELGKIPRRDAFSIRFAFRLCLCGAHKLSLFDFVQHAS